MSIWKEIQHPLDPYWIEWHKEVISARHGRGMLKLWMGGSGSYFTSFTKVSDNSRYVQYLFTHDLGLAKKWALEWIEAN